MNLATPAENPPARLIRPAAARYLYLAVQTAAQHRPGPVLGRDQRRADTITALQHYATDAGRSADVTAMWVFRAVIADPFARPVPPARRHHAHPDHGRRGTYFRDPDGHLMEILTPGS